MEQSRNIYLIPANFKQSGRVFNGMISSRNAIDAGVLGLLGFLFAKSLHISPDNAISVYILCAGLPAMLGLIGIHQMPISTYLIYFLQWTRRRKVCLYNSHSGMYSVSSADLVLNTPQLKDTIADTIDKVKDAMQKEDFEYIEGETFEFAEDPDLIALQKAEKEKHPKPGTSDTADFTVPAEKTTADKNAEKPHTSKSKLADVFNSIHLSEGGESSYGKK